jgi:hypothetical protein
MEPDGLRHPKPRFIEDRSSFDVLCPCLARILFSPYVITLALFGTKLRLLFATSRLDNYRHTFTVVTMDLATVQDWNKSTREHLKASDHLDAIDALITLINDSKSPSAAAAIITKAYSNYVEQPLEDSESDRVQRFWGILCDAARTFGSAQKRLIDLLYEISTQPEVKATDRSIAKDRNGRIYWRHLPGLPFALCDDALR